jgi:hypothetical protein
MTGRLPQVGTSQSLLGKWLCHKYQLLFFERNAGEDVFVITQQPKDGSHYFINES